MKKTRNLKRAASLTGLNDLGLASSDDSSVEDVSASVY